MAAREEALTKAVVQDIGYDVVVDLRRVAEGPPREWGYRVVVVRHAPDGERFEAEEFVFDSEAKPVKFDAFKAAAIKAAGYLKVFDNAESQNSQ